MCFGCFEAKTQTPTDDLLIGLRGFYTPNFRLLRPSGAEELSPDTLRKFVFDPKEDLLGAVTVLEEFSCLIGLCGLASFLNSTLSSSL